MSERINFKPQQNRKSLKLHQQIRFLSYNAITLAIILLMAGTKIGYITLGFLSITLIHIPCLVFSYQTGYKYSYIYGLMFGFSSMMMAFVASTGFDIIFRNPLISVVPRVIFAIVAGVVFTFVKKIQNLKLRTTVCAISSMLLTMLHTLLVMTFLYICAKDNIYSLYMMDPSANFENANQTFNILFTTSLLTGMIPESIVAFIVVPLIAIPAQNIFDFSFSTIFYNVYRNKIKLENLNKSNPKLIFRQY